MSEHSSTIGNVTDLSPFARYARHLTDYYSTARISPDFKWPLTPSTAYVDTTVIEKKPVARTEATEFTLALVHGDVNKAMSNNPTRSFSLEDILKPSEEERLRYVLVEGAPGIGKSTFAWELCRRWDKLEALRRFSLVVLLRLRDEYVQKATSFEDIFFHDDQQLQQAVVKEVVRTDGEGVLFIMDGADECPASVRNNPRSMFYRLLSGSSLPRATVLVTSRKLATRDLLRQNKPDRNVEILGFTEAQISQYTESAFQSEPELLASFQSYVSSNPAVRGILYVPVSAAIAIAVFRENTSKGGTFPTTLTQLYSELCSLLLQRYLLHANIVEDADDLPRGIDDPKFPGDIHERFLSLAAVAFEGISTQQLVFTELPAGSKSLGFITSSPELHTGRRHSYNFLHLTVQEYLAAVHVTTLPPEQQKELFRKHGLIQHFKRMWQFVAGLTKFKEIGWDLVSSHWGVGHFLLTCLYEAQDQPLCEEVLGTDIISFEPLEYTDDTYTEFHYCMTESEGLALGYCIVSSKCAWVLCLNYLAHDSLAVLEMIAQGARSVALEHISSIIDTLRLEDLLLQPLIWSCLKQLPLSTVSEFKIIECLLADKTETFRTFAKDIVPVMSSLTHFEMIYNNRPAIGPDEMAVVLGALAESASANNSLRSLVVDPHSMGCSSNEALQRLVSAGSLETLQLGCRATLYCHGEYVLFDVNQVILDTIFAPSSLRSVILCKIRLASSMNAIATLLERNSNLEELEIFACHFGGLAGATSLALSLHTNNTLLNLTITAAWDLMRNQPDRNSIEPAFDTITDDGAIAFAQMLKTNRSLISLNLTCHTGAPDEQLGLPGATALAEAISSSDSHIRIAKIHTRCTPEQLQELSRTYPNIDSELIIFRPTLTPLVTFD